MFFALCYQNKSGKTMQIATLATLNSAQNINSRPQTQISQSTNSFKNEIEKAQEFAKKDFKLV